MSVVSGEMFRNCSELKQNCSKLQKFFRTKTISISISTTTVPVLIFISIFIFILHPIRSDRSHWQRVGMILSENALFRSLTIHHKSLYNNSDLTEEGFFMFDTHNAFEKVKIINGSLLKIIAVVCMLIDHLAFLILPHLELFSEPIGLFGKEFTIIKLGRLIGRVAFPIFAFLITEGFLHTKNHKKYGINLFAFALVSEIPYNLFLSGKIFNINSQNVYFTLFLGFLALYVLDNIKNDTEKAIYIFGIVVLSLVLKGDYGVKGVILILVLYLLKNQLPLASVLSLGLLSGGVAAWCAFLPINMYNGKRGFIKGKATKYAFYAFYPVHLLILFAIKKFILL